MAAHLEEQQELDNFKHFWKGWGRWLFAVLVIAALGYLGYTMYQRHQVTQSQEAAGVLEQLVTKAQQKADQKVINADLQKLQENYPQTIAAAQATLMVAATEFDAGRYDVAAGHLNWVLKNQKAPLVQALAAQRMAVVKLQQKKYDEALNALNTPVEVDFEPLLLETKGDVYVAQNKAKEAVESYEQALGKTAKDAAARDLLQMKIDALK
ncbi:YfgM family protein [Neisseria perflava]|uniref:YfgM family protein n=1 Tax=Neisseria perflava TaxID=33053 RepID=UPI00209DAA77|nr:tetratricopeptide repeat protein [Neisseria perflava]MCP1660594.1 putative negative regulator of RcsB-dependent stress response [Neisseria perflava]MCP1772406.1 putative negative regulator of RcsB-dependent stress response [Neisseria perflava]